MIRPHSAALGAVVLAALSSACASTGAVPRPFPAPAHSGPAASGAPTVADGTAPPASPVETYRLVGTALDLRGTPYRNGGADPHGFDCSGFTQYVFAQYGLWLPRTVHDQSRMGTAVNPGQIAAGDLIFFATTEPGASHVGIAVGGDQFVHAPSSTGVVRVERLGADYWAARYVGARRLTPP